MSNKKGICIPDEPSPSVVEHFALVCCTGNNASYPYKQSLPIISCSDRSEKVDGLQKYKYQVEWNSDHKE